MKKLFFWISVIILCLLIIYHWPVTQSNFESIYIHVSPKERYSLRDFREKHPVAHIKVDGRKWEYISLGEGEQTFLFLHGMTGAYDIWWQILEPLSKQFRVMSLTYPPVKSLESYGNGIVAVLDAEKVDKAIVVGTSLGGYLTQYLLTHHPDRLEGMVLSNTFPPNDMLIKKNRNLIRILPFLPNWLIMKGFRQNFSEIQYPASGYSEMVLAYLNEQASGRMNKPQVMRRAKAVVQFFDLPKSDVISIPVLIVESANDPLVDSHLREQLKTFYPHAQIYTFTDAGHFPYINESKTYLEVLLGFLEKGLGDGKQRIKQ
ncbi:MAG TPA: alpha/beta hydrolase [Saprospiraceae bacterium]|nr:alpha/beta hydrolase [Saprospiraceae bacterium]